MVCEEFKKQPKNYFELQYFHLVFLLQVFHSLSYYYNFAAASFIPKSCIVALQLILEHILVGYFLNN